MYSSASVTSTKKCTPKVLSYLPHLTDYQEFNTRPNTAAFYDNTVVGRSENGAMQMYVKWRETSIVDTRRADEASQNTSDSVAIYQERKATVRDFGILTMQDMK
jgi:hypothetical protein